MDTTQSAQDTQRNRGREVERKRVTPQEGKTSYMWIGIAVGLVILLAFLYSVFFPAKANSVSASGPFELLAPGNIRNGVFGNDVDRSNKFMINDMDEAIQFFVYLDGTLRMGQSIEAGSSGSNIPSQDSGLYQKCQCTSNSDCTNCLPHRGYQTIMNIQDTFILEILNSPDASRPNAVAAQIYVKTQIQNNFNIETFPLPPLPEQKWTMVTISKQGRQINVYYNSTLVLAKKAQNNFATQTPTCAPVSVGSNSLSGKVAMVTYFNSHQTISDVAARYQAQTDTRGNLNSLQIKPSSTSYTMVDNSPYGFVKSLCLDLSCFSGLIKREKLPTIPVNTVMETQYA
jgi:hypothetical protein